MSDIAEHEVHIIEKWLFCLLFGKYSLFQIGFFVSNPFFSEKYSKIYTCGFA